MTTLRDPSIYSPIRKTKFDNKKKGGKVFSLESIRVGHIK